MALVGRVAERIEIDRFLADAAHERATLLFEGEAGIGKSALFDAVLARAEQFIVLSCRCAEPESTLGYAGLADLIGTELEPAIERLPPPQRRALEVALLRADPGDETVERQTVGRAALTLLHDLTRVRPVLVAVDDLQWLDRDSSDVLTFALRRLDSAPIGLVATVRVGESTTQLAALAPDARHVRVDPMSGDDLESLLASRLSVAPTRGLFRRVLELSGGNPLYALELCRAADPATCEPALPSSLESLLRDRLEALPQSAREVLAAIALLGSPRRPLVAAALDRDVQATDGAIDVALDDGVVIERDGRLRFVHPLFAAAAASTVTHGLRRQVNRRLADLATDVEDRARHLALATSEPDEDVASGVEAGAQRARARAAPDVAGELADAAVRLTPPALAASVRRRTVDAAYHHVASGALAVGLARMRAALGTATSPNERADVLWRCAMLQFLAGDLDQCIAGLEDALVTTDDPVQRTMISRRLASMSVWLGRFHSAHTLATRALEDNPEPELHEQIGLLSVREMTSYVLGDGITDGVIEQLEGLTATTGTPGAQEHWLTRCVPIVLQLRGPDRVRDMLAPLYAASTEAVDDLGVAWVGGKWTEVELAAGRWDHATEVAEAALRAGQRSGSPPALLFGLEATALTAVLRGEHERARETADALIRHAKGEPVLWRDGTGHVVFGFLALSTGDSAVACDEFARAEDALAHLEVRALRIPFLRWYQAQALVEDGQLDAAEVAAGRLAQVGATFDDPLILAAASRVRGAVYSARGEHDAAQNAMETALRENDRLAWPFERAMTLFLYGRAQRRGRRNRAARELLESARNQFKVLGAPLWVARANAELARIGGRTPQMGQLTDTEQRVAELAAGGLTNNEIAERLFVSVKTVATHLSNTYAKLAVRSRTELAHRLRND